MPYSRTHTETGSEYKKYNKIDNKKSAKVIISIYRPVW